MNVSVEVFRMHGEHNIKTVVRVSDNGSPSIEMTMSDFKKAVLAELGPVWSMLTMAEADRRIGKAVDTVITRMKKDTEHPIAALIR